MSVADSGIAGLVIVGCRGETFELLNEAEGSLIHVWPSASLLERGGNSVNERKGRKCGCCDSFEEHVAGNRGIK